MGGGKGLIHAACGHKSTTGALLALDMHSGVYDLNGHGQPGYVVTAKCSAIQDGLLQVRPVSGAQSRTLVILHSKDLGVRGCQTQRTHAQQRVRPHGNV